MSEPKKVSKPAFGKLEIIVIVCLVAFIAWLAIPNFIKARATSADGACINRLREIGAAANQFALEHHKAIGDAINFPDDLTPYIKLTHEGKIRPCPQGGTYHMDKVGDRPTCSLGSTVTPPHVLQ